MAIETKSPLKNFENLRVYQKSLDLVSRILAVTEKYPRSERYELVSQIRRAAVSIPSNIVEGYSRRTRKEYIQFLSIAYSSCRELATHLRISRMQDYISEADFQKIDSTRDIVAGMLWKLMDSLAPHPSP